MTVIRFMLTALVVAAVLVRAAVNLGIGHAPPVPPTFVLANLAGGMVFGVGMATAGYCSGTVVAQAGEGRLDAWAGGLSGLIVGAIAFGALGITPGSRRPRATARSVASHSRAGRAPARG